MNLYFLVEGKSEFNLYPKWLTYLLPDFTRVDEFDRISDRNYFIFQGGGQPEIIEEHLPNAIRDINSLSSNDNKYDYLLFCLDAEEQTIDELKTEILTSLCSKKDIDLSKLELVLIIQNRCIETWLLGNRNFVPTQFGNTPLDECEPFLTYRNYYDVRDKDPELMGIYDNEKFRTHAQFHEAYLKAVFKANTSDSFRK
ncbi:hypothetical protein V2H45_24255 [Tumidithrix elongata RA019]|uniref:DUF4276 family protein n=1 Tax=Tumidithrix elongata BACA0141 TaxID=2716417 RepID=A0AAW9Q9H9_9CYAN|nr:hypothetical protein [Tumidithrix elongata RA019]